jgi:pSer/pThr/pTyr-binding forkhead associated (FHA) protein
LALHSKSIRTRASEISRSTPRSSPARREHRPRIQLGEDPVRIGRLPDCAIPLSDSQASRHHAEVRPSDHGFVVVDLDSLNGTTVNGVVIHEKHLEAGDVITIGETAIRYEES